MISVATATPKTACDALLAAFQRLARENPAAAGFHVSDLVVAAWQDDPMRFGLHGYRDTFPSDNRVKVELISKRPGGLLYRGLIEWVKPSVYRLTAAGRKYKIS